MALEETQKAYQDAEAEAVALQAEKDEALAAVWSTYRPRLQAARDRAVEAQRAMLNAEAVAELSGREDVEGASALARSLGLVASDEEFLALRNG